MDNPAFSGKVDEAGIEPALTTSQIQLSVIELSPPANGVVGISEDQGHDVTSKIISATDKESKSLFLPVNVKELDKDGDKTTTAHTINEKENDIIDDNEDIACGIGWFKPPCLQSCMTIGYFTVVYSLCGLVTSGLGVYMNSQITTLEKHFNFNSSMSGFLMSCNDLGYLLTTLIMSYYTRRVHIPRGLALSTAVFGMSGLVCTIAFFGTRDQIASPSQFGDTGSVQGKKSFAQMCENSTSLFISSPNATCEEISERTFSASEISTSWKTLAICFLAFGMLVQGMAKSPRHPFLATYVDDNVPKTMTTMYLGIMTGFAIFGPAMAFMLGGMFSRMYVTLEETDMSFRDPRWIGAWWLGFLAFGLAGLVVSIPLSWFPRRLKGRRRLEGIDNTKDTSHQDKKKTQIVASDIKGFLQSLKRLLTNPVYVLITLSTGLSLMGVSGMMAFSPKYLETQFTVPVWKANMTLGSTNVIAASLGTILGGILTSRLKLSPLTCLRFVLALSTISGLFVCLAFTLGCDQPAFESSQFFDSNGTSIGECSAACNCDEQNFFPVCGSDNKNYFSPCHAGCTATRGSNIFKDCSCITPGINNSTSISTPSTTTTTLEGDEAGTATAGLCESDCGKFYPYVACMFLSAFCACMVIMPNFVAYVRSVSEADKPLAIGLMAFGGTLLGWFPGPVVFGLLVDTTCIIWKTSCDSVGACSLYDLDKFRFRYHAFMIALRIINATLLIAVLLIVHYSKTFKFQSHTDENDTVAVRAGKDDSKSKNSTDVKSSIET